MLGAQSFWTRVNGEEPREVELEPNGPGRFRARLGERVYEVDARELPGGGLSLLVEGASLDLRLEGEGEQLALVARGERTPVEVIDERRRRLGAVAAKPAATGPAVVTAPMPGKVVRVLVAVGEAVEEGRGVAVVEAMKMENELRSPRAGKVAEIVVKEGQTVEGGARLVVIA